MLFQMVRVICGLHVCMYMAGSMLGCILIICCTGMKASALICVLWRELGACLQHF